MKEHDASISERMMVLFLLFFIFVTCIGYNQITSAKAQEIVWRHGLSLMGQTRYPASFRHFDYVNANAPKGGRVRMATTNNFDSLNLTIPKGSIAPGLSMIYDSLLTKSYDETSSAYGLIAQAVTYPPDISSATYRLRAQARWNDGRPITPEDVIFSFDMFKKLHPLYSFYYRNIVKIEKTGARDVTFTFDERHNRELPLIIGELTILPRHWWQGRDSSGVQRDITKSTLEPPLGSGPYRISRVAANNHIIYQRVTDYWARDLAVTRGTNNFDEIRYDVYRDSNVALEAFKAGRIDWRAETQAKRWATGYVFPDKTKKFVKLASFPDRARGIMQAYVFNLRRDKFSDPRVRRAFNLAFNFEAMNKSIFHGQYQRIDSYFAGSELASSGLPQGRELELLEQVRDLVPPDVFSTPYSNPRGGDQRAMRRNLRQASNLLRQAGWEIRAGRRVNALTGVPLDVEFLYTSPDIERVILSYKPWLERLGIEVTLRLVDSSQYINRVRSFDFDVITYAWGQSLSPGNEQREFFGSHAADTPGTRNVAGIRNPAVDKLINAVIFAEDREELTAAVKALDRVLLWNHYVVPQYKSPVSRIAYWDRMSYPDPLPPYSVGFPKLWWWDKDKADGMDTRSR